MLASFGSVLLVLFNGGRQVGRVEAAISRLTGIEESLKRVADHEVKLGILQETVNRTRSDFKDLRNRLLENIEEGAEMRGKLESRHDK